jgi:selenocysteine lyase/cysteine desulfurase
MNSAAIREREFGGLAQAVYLNHAASFPLPARSAAALRRYIGDREQVVHLYQTGRFDYDPAPLRAGLGRLLGCPARSVGFAPTTNDGMAAVLNGVPWTAGDNLVVPANDFPGVLYACLRLERRGVEVRQVPTPSGHLALEDLLARVDRRTRAVAVSHVHWCTGHRIDLKTLGTFCRSRGVLSVVDAIQSTGVVPIDVTEAAIDVLAAGSYKWLLGVPGAAVLYLSDQALATSTPDRAGWTSVRTSVHSGIDLAWKEDAMRFQVGGLPDPVLIAMEQSVDLLLEVGIEAIHVHTAVLTERLAAGLAAHGFRITSHLDPAHRSAILNFTTGSAARDEQAARHLAGRGIIVSKRGPGIRVAPHLHNVEADIDRLLEELEGL